MCITAIESLLKPGRDLIARLENDRVAEAAGDGDVLAKRHESLMP